MASQSKTVWDRDANFPGQLILYVVPKIFGSSVWNLLHVKLLAPRILKWLQDIWKICATLVIDLLTYLPVYHIKLFFTSKLVAEYNRRRRRQHLRQSPQNQSPGEVVITRPTYIEKIPRSDLGREQSQSCLKFDVRPGSPQTIKHNTQTALCNRPRPFFLNSLQCTTFSVISGSLSPRHGASSGCGWRNGLRYGG